ncbi:MAG: bifunctional riboflavin kinase/FAD synthetase [Burkholderiaceae bacterium]
MEVFHALPAPAAAQSAAVADNANTAGCGLGGCGLAIGNFDGVHRGHQAIIAQLKEAAGPLPVTVMTFEPHPREFFASRHAAATGQPIEAPARISTETDRLNALRDCGVDTVCIVPFNEAFANMPAADFIERVICGSMQARHLMVGDDFRFGAQRQGDYKLLCEHAACGRFELHRMPTLTHDNERVSSSLVRRALAQADFATVSLLLGRPYTISGPVIRGKQLGRTLGYPTLNVGLPFVQPAVTGVFVVQTHGLGQDPLPGVASLGVRPAVESAGKFLLEVHLFDFDRTVYGEQVQVEFLHKLRDEENYDSLELLTKQIAIDARQARDYFASTGN